MPPCPSQRDLRKLVRKLDVDARHGEQRQALATITKLSLDPDNMAAMAAAGVIPALAQLMATSSRDGVQLIASGALMGVFNCPSATPHLVQLLGLDNPVRLREIAAGYLSDMSKAPEHATTLIAFGVIPQMTQLLGPGSSAEMHYYAVTALRCLAFNNAGSLTAISAAGAIPPLVQLLGPRSAPDLQEATAGVLSLLAANRDDAATIAAAGAVLPLVQLLLPGAPTARLTAQSLACGRSPQQLEFELKVSAAGALSRIALLPGNAATIAAAGAIPRLVQLLAPGYPSDVQANAVMALAALATHGEVAVALAADGAIPPLVQLLGPSDLPGAQKTAAVALMHLAANAANADTIAAAGAIPPLVRMTGPDCPAEVIKIAEDALRVLGDSSAEISAAIAAAEANANALLMARLGLD